MLWQPALPERYRLLTEPQLAAEIAARRKQLGGKLLILGHHYQQDEVIQHADLTGDSLKLSQMAAEESRARGSEFIVFCGVHFMAETADILTPDEVKVILPDLSAGCSMADMAEYDDAVQAWDTIQGASAAKCRVIPITYVNSSAAIKAFVGANGGACCTSSNASQVFDWALHGGDTPLAKGETVKILFLPDQHLGRNTAKAKGIPLKDMALWNPRAESGGLDTEQLRDARVILWAGHCSVHKLFRPEHIDQVRAQYKDKGGITVLVHPECAQEVVDAADMRGSTEYIIGTIQSAKPGSNWAVGTEVHLVNRLSRAAAERGVHVRMLSECQCLCTTMYRIDQAHLLWVLDNLAEGCVVNQVKVHAQARQLALLALERMLRNVAKSARSSAKAPALVD